MYSRHHHPTPELRPYQHECISTCLEQLHNRNVRRQLVSLPVGSGKTVIFANLIQQLRSAQPNADDHKVLVLAHRTELLDQAEAQIKRFAPEVRVGKDSMYRKIDPNDYDVVVSSVNALGRTESKRLEKYDRAAFKYIVIDEAHHAPAPSYVRVLQHFDALHPMSDVFVWGCTATARRADGVALGKVFDEVTFIQPLPEMIQQKWLCDFRAEIVNSDVNLDKVGMASGDFAVGQLSATVNTDERNKLILRTYKQFCRDRKSTLVFATDLEHVETLRQHFSENGIDARSVTGKTKAQLRRDTVADFRSGEFPVMVNCGVFTEGTDIPNIDCIIMARPTRSPVLYQQMVGRGLRIHPDKDHCLLIDVVDQTSRAPLVTHPTLLGLHPGANLRGRLASSVDRKMEAMAQDFDDPLQQNALNASDAEIMNAVFADDEDNPFALLDTLEAGNKRAHALAESPLLAALVSQARTSKDLLQPTTDDDDDDQRGDAGLAALWPKTKSKYDWFMIKLGHIALQLPEFKTLEVVRGDDGKWEARVTSSWRPGGSGAVIRHHTPVPATGDTIEHMLRACETYLEQELLDHYAARYCHTWAPWKRAPASDKQRKFLEKLGWTSKQPQWALDKLTKGKANQLIARYTEGGSKQMQQVKSSWKKVAEQDQQRKKVDALDEPLKLGPLRK
ncbi:putative ATP-dependent helicase IRC3 [Sorochytrium milnesiophthora]